LCSSLFGLLAMVPFVPQPAQAFPGCYTVGAAGVAHTVCI
jgi:hypothetical protein